MGVQDKPGTRVGMAVRHVRSLHRWRDSVITKEQLYRGPCRSTKTPPQTLSLGSAWVWEPSSAERVESRERIVTTWVRVFCSAASKLAMREST